MAPRTPQTSKRGRAKKKPDETRTRLAIGDSPKIATHVVYLFVGPPSALQLVTIHTEMIPERALAVINALGYEHGFFRLADIELDTVEMWRSFLYTGGKLFCKSGSETCDDGGEAELEDQEWLALARAYLLGTLLGYEEFANAAVDGLIEKTDEGERYPDSLACEVWPATQKGDCLRRLIVDFHVWKGLGEGVKLPHADADGPEDFQLEVRKCLKRNRKDMYREEIVDIWKVDRCRYHQHQAMKRCSR